MERLGELESPFMDVLGCCFMKLGLVECGRGVSGAAEFGRGEMDTRWSISVDEATTEDEFCLEVNCKGEDEFCLEVNCKGEDEFCLAVNCKGEDDGKGS